MSLIGKRYAEDLKDFVNGSFKFHSALQDGYKTVGTDGSVDLDPYRVFSFTLELFDFEMLFHPFEEEFNFPSVLVKV